MLFTLQPSQNYTSIKCAGFTANPYAASFATALNCHQIVASLFIRYRKWDLKSFSLRNTVCLKLSQLTFDQQNEDGVKQEIKTGRQRDRCRNCSPAATQLPTVPVLTRHLLNTSLETINQCSKEAQLIIY